MTSVVEMTLGVTTWAWLCSNCITRRKAADWTVKVKQVIAWGCDDCELVAQAAPEYVTPTVAYVPTSADSFCPAPGWKRDEPMNPWPKPARRGRTQQQPIAEGEAA